MNGGPASTEPDSTSPATQHDPEEQHVSFDALIEKVHQAELALEGKEREATIHLRQTKASWRAAWTPGRIVFAGLVAGFVTGRAEPLKRAAGGGTLQLISALGSLLAGDKAAQAADQASEAADAAEGAERGAVRATPRPEAVARPAAATAAAASPPAAAAARPAPTQRTRAETTRNSPPDERAYDLPDNYRDSGQL